MYVTECSDDSVVIFDRVVKDGQGIYYMPYWENEDTIPHGYIMKVEDL